MKPVAPKTLALALALLLSVVASAAHATVTVTLTTPPKNYLGPYPAPATIELDASASVDDPGYSITQVDFYQGTTLIGSTTTAPYTFFWSSVPSGSYSLTAQATARKGSKTKTGTSAPLSIIVDDYPTVTMTSPANGAVFTAPASFTMTADAADADGTVTRVDFYRNSGELTVIGTDPTPPYSIDVSNLTPGSYSFTAWAYDDLGGIKVSNKIFVTVNAPPSVSITSPTNNATFTAPASITITASAADSDGTINRVDFYEGSTLLGSASTAPYAYDWTNVAAGTYALTAHAIDNNNGQTISSPVNVTVNAAAATLYFIEVDHLNTPRLVADATGTTVWKWDQQEPFGDSPADENPSGLGIFDLPLRLPGQYADKETSVNYNYYRDYDSAIGRFIESDPLGLGNRAEGVFLYVAGNPLLSSDPEGLATTNSLTPTAFALSGLSISTNSPLAGLVTSGSTLQVQPQEVCPTPTNIQRTSPKLTVVAQSGYYPPATLASMNLYPISILPGGTIYFPVSGSDPRIPPGYVYVPGGLGVGKSPGGSMPSK